jgi:LytS/YehU family sensor histidine kinase
VLALAISSSLKVTSEWFKNENQKKEMENEKLSSELLFLKSQVNPHFFFNTLNNIYSLANSKSDNAPVAIAKLSQLMRYMLYESNVSLVPLSRELEYLHSYIDLQRLRFRNNIRIDFSIEGAVDDKMIEPMLFIPFVENAFKHGPSLQQNPSIAILLRTFDHQLYFSVENTFEKNGNEYKDKNSGIGLQNIKRRLDLLYPNSHELIVHESKPVFKVELTLTLS